MKRIFMISKESAICTLLCICVFFAQAQKINWENPAQKEVLQGRVNSLSIQDGYHRLPISLENKVRKPVWNLGTQSAGVYIDFKTQADSIFVRYKVNGNLNMPHMPTTGVSGLDLYLKDENGKDWKWAHGRYNFADSIQYSFENIGQNKGSVFRLYLPLYNSVDWLEIGVKEGNKITYVSNAEKPIVVYGTSIAQGACASRPGLAWTGFLGRNFTNPVINLGFSGNGRLEQPVLDLINQQDASVFILDCIPNLSIKGQASEEKFVQILKNAVSTLRKDHPKTPIVFTAHSASNLRMVINKTSNEEYNLSTSVGKALIESLIAQGDKNLYWLDSEELNMDINSTVDYAHPNDIGMQKIAEAYTTLIQNILGN